MVLASVKPGSDARTTEAAIRTDLERHHGVRVQSHDEIEAQNQSDSDKIVALVDVMLALSLIISLFGIVNTLILSVLERTREIGLMRAVGASRRQVRRVRALRERADGLRRRRPRAGARQSSSRRSSCTRSRCRSRSRSAS